MVDSKHNFLLRGVILKIMPGNKFIVQLIDKYNKDVICKVSTKLIRKRIKILVSDKVEVEFSVWGDKGLIVSKL